MQIRCFQTNYAPKTILKELFGVVHGTDHINGKGVDKTQAQDPVMKV